MAIKLKKNHLTNWDVERPNEKSTFDDDQDSYISERSSVSSLDETIPSTRTNNHHRSPPVPKKEAHSLVYSYNKLPENGIPLATQAKQEKKEEIEMRKKIRKAPPGQGSLAPLPEPKPSELGENYYPYWYYYKAKNPDWIMRHRQYADGQVVPYNSIDPSKYIHQPAVETPPKKSRRRHKKAHRDDAFVMQYNPDKKNYEWVWKDSLPKYHENSNQQRTSPKQYTSLNDVYHDERSNQPSRTIGSRSNGKLKTENDWHNHYIQSMTTNKLPQDSNTSKHHHSKKMRSISPGENNNHQHSHSSSSHSHHHHHHHRHHHHHHHHQSKEYANTEFQVHDASFKKSERTPFFQQTPNSFQSSPNSFQTSPTSFQTSPNSFQSSPPAIYNQSSYLPPISRDHHYRSNPVDYFSTPTLDKDWRNSLKSPKINKPNSQTDFYDRYLNNVIIKKLT
jgi:hypothetical protein